MEKIRQRPLPLVHAMLICEKVISEEKTRKKSLIGVFDTVYYLRLPVGIPELWIYVNLSDVVGKLTTRIELVYLNENRKVAEAKLELPEGRLNREVGYCFKNMVFAKTGTYVFRFWVDDDVISEKYLNVTRRP